MRKMKVIERMWLRLVFIFFPVLAILFGISWWLSTWFVSHDFGRWRFLAGLPLLYGGYFLAFRLFADDLETLKQERLRKRARTD
ncbi:hypothetical protein KPL74_17820 [Bacillus sp. NP157]|nr:hypothetical protein KPL74_17820 [Bacillus sp. NP157]